MVQGLLQSVVSIATPVHHDDAVVEGQNAVAAAVLLQPAPTLLQLLPITPEGTALPFQKAEVHGDPIHLLRGSLAVQVGGAEGKTHQNLPLRQ